MTRVPPAERTAYRVTVDQPAATKYRIRVDAPDGRFAQWFVFQSPTGAGIVCNADDPAAMICKAPTFEDAARKANLRARHWLGSCWGLKGPARRLP